MKRAFPLFAAVLAACSSNESSNDAAPANTVAMTNGAEASNVADAAPADAGFDLAAAPVANPTLGAWPYFGIQEGYKRVTPENAEGDSIGREFFRDVEFDRYQFFDGHKLIPVEGRLTSFKASGKGASFFQVQKTYEKLVKDLGGVTVFEGTGEAMTQKKLAYAENRHRARYYAEKDQSGVYMVRTPDREIWVEVFRPYETSDDSYWLTVVEKKALEVKVKMIPAEAMKAALDSAGHIALYLNFDTDKTAIRPEAQPVIAEVVKLLTANPALKLSVEGHTDDAGTPAHNKTLSDGRANAVMGALIAAGIAPARLSASGFGQTKPIADNANEDGKAKNRRVELVKKG